jgi:AcrR family transcriptional regulator
MSTPRPYRMVSRARGVAHTRAALLQAARDRFSRLPYDEVSLRDVARDAGVSTQTLHAHFRTKDDLLESVGTTFADALSQDLLTSRGRPTSARGVARALVEQYEHTGDANVRLLALSDRSPAAVTIVERGRREHLAWLTSCLGDRLPADEAPRRRVLDALYVATDVGTWKLLRRDLRRSRAATIDAMTLLVSAAIARGAPATRGDPLPVARARS